MKKGLLKKALKLGTLAAAMSTVAFASTASDAVGNVMSAAQNLVQAGGVLAAAWGGYKVLLGDNAKGVHWFLLIAGGAVAAGYTQIQTAVVSFFA